MRKSILLLSSVAVLATCSSSFASGEGFVEHVRSLVAKKALVLSPEFLKVVEDKSGRLHKHAVFDKAYGDKDDAKKNLSSFVAKKFVGTPEIESLAAALIGYQVSNPAGVTAPAVEEKKWGATVEGDGNEEDLGGEAEAAPASPPGGKHGAVVGERGKLEEALSIAEDQLAVAKKAKKGLKDARRKVALALKRLDAFDAGGGYSEAKAGQGLVEHVLNGVDSQIASEVAPVLKSVYGLEDDALRVLVVCLREMQMSREQAQEKLVLQQFNKMLPHFSDAPPDLESWLQRKLNPAGAGGGGAGGGAGGIIPPPRGAGGGGAGGAGGRGLGFIRGGH